MSVILHVEDDLGHALLIGRALEGLPFASDVKLVTDGQAAVDYLNNWNEFVDPTSFPRPKLVLLDLNLPKIKGFDILKLIKGREDLRDIPVVILTTSDSAEDRNICFENQADAFLTKPGGYLELVNALHQVAEEWLINDASANN
jgi:CheY-like chemotaxis protein